MKQASSSVSSHITWLLSGLIMRPGWVVVAVVTAFLVFRLLTEWQRRITIVTLVRLARPGTVVVQDRGACGPALRIQVGGQSGPDPGTSQLDAP